MHWFFYYMLVVSGAGSSLLLALLFLIAYATPKRFRDYALILGNQTISLLLLAFLETYLSPRIIAVTGGTAIMIYGPAKNESDYVGYFLYYTFSSRAKYIVFSVFFPFIHRYFVLKNWIPRQSTLTILLLFSHIPYIVENVFAVQGMTESGQVTGVLMQEHNYSLDGAKVVGKLGESQSWAHAYLFALAMYMPPIVYIATFFIRWRINRLLDITHYAASSRTKQIHRHLMKVFTMQAIVPLINIISSYSYVLAAYRIVSHPALEFLGYGLGPIIILAEAVISLWCIPYYKFASQNLVYGRYMNGNPTNRVTRVSSIHQSG